MNIATGTLMKSNGSFKGAAIPRVLIRTVSKKAAILHAISIECSALEVEWQDLWGDLDDIDDTEARQRNTRLSRRLTEVTGWAGHTDIQEDPKLNEKCEAAAYRVIQDQYGV